MAFQVTGKLTSTVVFGDNKQDRKIFNILQTHKVNDLFMFLESIQLVYGTYSNISIRFDEMFDGSMDDWHDSIEIKANIKTLIDVESKQEALDIMNAFYDSDFSVDIMYLFMSNGDMLELDTMNSTWIVWEDAIEVNKTLDRENIIQSKLHLDYFI